MPNRHLPCTESQRQEYFLHSLHRYSLVKETANLLPEDKMRIIKEYAGGTEPICMIGDGVNDALALATADAGIAMGGIGSDIAIESADAVPVSDDIKRIPYLLS